MSDVPALQRSLPDIVREYDEKKAALPDALKAFNRAVDDMKMSATVAGTYGQVNIDVRGPWESALQTHLLKSAWLHVYEGLNIKVLSSPTDKRQFDQAMASPPEFTIDNIRGTFGRFILDPRGNILRGLAEVFCGLDQAYKSHDKVKIGVAGLPKRIIVSSVGGYGSYGRDKLLSVINALASYQGRPLIEQSDFAELDNLHRWDGHRAGTVTIRGLTIKKFQNGNAHVMFDKGTMDDINKALAEFYGDVLPDTTGEKPTEKQASTAVSKDLQYYPTPVKIVENVLRDLYNLEGALVLDPSCGCGRFLDGLKARGAQPYGVEVDPKRVAECRAKGHKVLQANFLETAAVPKFDHVVMNPPFYGKHYAKHVQHALKFLKPGGRLTAILPVTARYDHGLLDGHWEDLPVGSFSESGTNINTTVLKLSAPSELPKATQEACAIL